MVCTVCGEIFSNEDGVFSEKCKYCRENLQYCSICQKAYDPNETDHRHCSYCGVDTSDGKWEFEGGDSQIVGLYGEENICEECLDVYFWYCDECDKYYPTSQDHQHCVSCGDKIESYNFGISGDYDGAPDDIGHDEILCEYCLRENYWWCEDCRQYFSYDDRHYHCNNCNEISDELDEDGRCPNCCRTPSRDGLRHENPAIRKFFTAKDISRARDIFDVKYVGMELEFNIPTEQDWDFRKDFVEEFRNTGKFDELFWLKSDSSLSESDGVEMCSHPMSMYFWRDEGEKVLEEILTEIENTWNGYIDSRCGLHFSFSRNWWDDKTHIARTAKLLHLQHIEIFRFSFRDDWDLLKKWANPRPVVLPEQSYIKGYKGSFGSRYTAINLENSNRIEFRIFASSLNPEYILQSRNFCIAVIDYARNAGNHDCYDWKKFYSVLIEKGVIRKDRRIFGPDGNLYEVFVF